MIRLIALVCLMAAGQWCLALDHPQLYGRSILSPEQLRLITLTDDDRRWLWALRTLRLGVSQPDYPPFDLTGTGSDYEGITADYARLVTELLNVRVEVTRYGSRERAVQALRTGEIDLLGSSNGFEAAVHDLTLSEQYAQDRSVLATRHDPAQPADVQAPGMTLAMLDDYLPNEEVSRLYPNARLVRFPSTLSALGAVSFGQADFFLGNALAAHYLIARNHFSNVQLAEFTRTQPNHFGFAMMPGNSRLMTLVNEALQAIPATEHQAILRRWSVAAVNDRVGRQLLLSEREKRWLKEHPRVRVVIDPRYLPISYRDGDGVFRGIAADLLERIAQRTGLTFEVIDAGSVDAMLALVTGGQADLLAAVPPSALRNEAVRFTRSFLTSSRVLVTRKGETVDAIDALADATVAVVAGSAMQAQLQARLPRMVVVPADNASQVLALVEAGRASAGVATLLGARYMISQRHGDRLHISAALPLEPANFAFATASDADELHGIVNKALLSFSPQELDELVGRWHNEVIVADGYWQRYRPLILQGFAAAALLWGLALGWISYLRRLIRRREVAEQALTDQLEFMRVLIDGTPHPIYVRDRNGALLTCNTSYLEALQVRREDILGLHLSDMRVVEPDRADHYQREYQRVMDHGQAILEDREVLLANGESRTLHHWMLPYRGSDGRIVGLIAGWIDVSERERLCRAYEHASADAEAANRAKTTFLAAMSHEIRTPMNAVLGMLEIARKKAGEGRLDPLALDVASDAAHSLLELIGDILDITRIESGHLELTAQWIELRPLFESVVQLFDSQAREKRITLHLELQDEQRACAWVDPLRLRQVVSNLISNAIKFTDQGQVRVKVVLTPVPGHVQLNLAVSDTGIGIAPQDLVCLGQPFNQARNHGQSQRAGSGLGLSICRGLCHEMGGELQLQSELGQGTVAAVALTLAAGPSPVCSVEPQTPPAAIPAVSLRVLVVDDYLANRLLLDHQLTWLGHRAVLARDGKEGLKCWLSAAFDVVISDCQMPELNGYELARAIRVHERREGRPPCLLLGCTANAQAEERARCRAAGMDDCLFKPLSLAALVEHLGAAVQRQPTGAVSQSDSPACVIDLGTLVELTGASPPAIRRLLADLLDSTRQDNAQLALLAATGEPEPIARLAHRIKGAAKIVGAYQVLSAIEPLEAACEQGAPLQALLQVLHQAMSDLQARLEAEVASPTPATPLP